MTIDENYPKHWSEKDGQVVPWVALESDPVDLASSAGTYGFVYEDRAFYGGEREDEDSLEIRFALGAQPTLDSMRGYMQVGTVKAEFIKYVHEDGHSLVALKALDDDGNRFMQFKRYLGYIGCCPYDVTYIAKRQTRSGGGLSDTEKQRLGIGLSVSEVEERAQREVEGSDSGSQGDGDDSGLKEGVVNSDVHSEGRADKVRSRKRNAEDAEGKQRNVKARKDASMKRNATSGRSRRRDANGK